MKPPDSTDELLLKVLGVLRSRVREDPYRMLGLAAVIGLAGGARLWQQLGASLLRAGARVAVAAVAPQMLGQIHTGSNGEEKHA